MATEWKKVKLQEICESISDGDHLPPPKAENGIPFVTISNIKDNQLDFTDTMFVPETYYEKLDNKRKAKTGDILYSVVGSFGIPVLLKRNEKFVFQRHIAILRPNKIDSSFLYYTMLGRDFYAKADAAAIGAAQRTVSLTSLRNIEICLPPLETQQKIAGILSAYDDLIENNRKQIKLLEEAAQKLYKEWFVKLNFPGHENVKIIDGVPEGWIYKKLDKVFNYVRGRSYSSEELSETKGTLFVNLKNIQAFGGYKRDAEKRYLGVYKSEQILSSGDVVLGITDMTKERRLVGSVAQIPELGETATFTMDLIKLEPYEITKNFLYSSLRFGGISRQISPLANGVNVLHLKPEALNQVEMLIPDSKLIQLYDEFYEPVRLKIEKNQKQIHLLQSARDKILPKLMNGEANI